jgi:hypothetical protein
MFQVRNVWKQIIGLFFGHEQDKSVMMAINFPGYGGDRFDGQAVPCRLGAYRIRWYVLELKWLQPHTLILDDLWL